MDGASTFTYVCVDSSWTVKFSIVLLMGHAGKTQYITVWSHIHTDNYIIMCMYVCIWLYWSSMDGGLCWWWLLLPLLSKQCSSETAQVHELQTATLLVVIITWLTMHVGITVYIRKAEVRCSSQTRICQTALHVVLTYSSLCLCMHSAHLFSCVIIIRT